MIRDPSLEEAPMNAQVVSGNVFLDELRQGLRDPKRDRTNHAFVQKATRGELSLRQIGGWLREFRSWADPSNKGIAVLWANTPDPEVRHELLENLMEEELGTSSQMGGGHVALVNEALEEFGLTAEEIQGPDMQYESWAFYHWWEVVLTKRSWLEGLAALSLAAEQINPIVFGKLAQALRSRYKVSERALRPFDVHASEIEIEHGKLADSAIHRYATTPWIQDNVRFAVFHTADMYYRFFNVYQAY
jgi:pyrroloquinoline quinone (PQQ) biosynthesis protein C